MMKDFRPLKTVGNAMSKWARRDNVQTTVQHSGRIRAAVDSFGIALGWMGRGYQYDERTLWQRLTDKSARYHFRAAVRALIA